MKIINWGIGQRKKNITPSVAALGNFDGIHLGHIKVLNEAKFLSKKLNLPLSVLTFDPHPREFFQTEKNFFLLQNFNQKKECLKKLGIQKIINLKFDSLLSDLKPETFVTKILSETLNIKHVFTGKDFKFGKNRSGNIETLVKVGKKCNIDVYYSEIKIVNEQLISSSIIRESLRKGDVQNANNLLGRPYSISGKVIKGDQRGRTIGFPTANIKLGNVIRPAFGVYSVLVKDENNNEYKGIANIGRRPTVNDRGELIEVNLFDREINLYDKELEIFLHHFIRAEKKFDNIDKLKKQISKDVKKAKSFLGF